MINGVLVRKLNEMEETLRRLREHLPTSYELFVENWGHQKIVERALQILIEAMIDIGERLVAVSGGPPCETAAAVMDRLQTIGVIKDAGRYLPMVRFRNFLVHQYERVDLAVLYGIATRRLVDVEAFIEEVAGYVETH